MRVRVARVDPGERDTRGDERGRHLAAAAAQVEDPIPELVVVDFVVAFAHAPQLGPFAGRPGEHLADAAVVRVDVPGALVGVVPRRAGLVRRVRVTHTCDGTGQSQSRKRSAGGGRLGRGEARGVVRSEVARGRLRRTVHAAHVHVGLPAHSRVCPSSTRARRSRVAIPPARCLLRRDDSADSSPHSVSAARKRRWEPRSSSRGGSALTPGATAIWGSKRTPPRAT